MHPKDVVERVGILGGPKVKIKERVL
uniref:Uncharacterized protein n=1 Tax=Lepeophtheirus salmonis TaxID=72036 RepID=A0A0K2V4Y0_LEPSM